MKTDRMFFYSNNFKDETNKILDLMRDEINKLTTTEFNSCSTNELVQYFIDKYTIELFSLDSSKPVLKHKRTDTRNEYTSEKLPHLVYTFHLAMTGDMRFIGFQPLMFYRSGGKVTPPNDTPLIVVSDETHSYLEVEIAVLASLAKSKGDSYDSFVRKKLNDKIDTFSLNLYSLNTDITGLNKKVESLAHSLIEEKAEAESLLETLDSVLTIPVAQKADAPNVEPITIEVIKKVISPPWENKEKAYEISDDIYDAINKVIDMAGRSFERTARTFVKLEEEEIRDVILSMLNTHFEIQAVGEAFNKSGKTDIYIAEKDSGAYVGELKIWDSFNKSVIDAIEKQLAIYTTWRETKTSLIIFNKTRQRFKQVCNNICERLNKYDKCTNIVETDTNIWDCEWQKSDDKMDKFRVRIMIYDICAKEKISKDQ